VDKLFIHGFPGLYGGAATEMHHQVPIWQSLGLEVHFIPTRPEMHKSPVFKEMQEKGCVIHGHNELSVIEKHSAVLGYCSKDYLHHLPTIRRFSENTIFVNCMTWLFEEERVRAAQGAIKTFLYQNDDVMKKASAELSQLCPLGNVHFMRFVPYFDSGLFPYVEQRSKDVFGCGRISRQDTDKFSVHTMGIYEYFVSPKPKRGLFLGFDARSESKTGPAWLWIRTARDQTECSQQAFYRHCEIVLQPTDTVENWPRVGLEAMSSGAVLIVDNRGGWKRMIEHGKTGWLCDKPADFIYYASKMAYEPDARAEIAQAAKARLPDLAGLEQSKESWKRVFERVLS
jgi:Glycosyl transferases group 1